MATLYTLPAHLRAVLTQFIDAGAGPETLKSKLQAALDAPAVEEEADEGELNSEDKDENKVDEKPRLRPPTIDAELLESLVSWAGGHEDELRAAGLGGFPTNVLTQTPSHTATSLSSRGHRSTCLPRPSGSPRRQKGIAWVGTSSI